MNSPISTPLGTLIVYGSYNGQVWGERDGREFAFDGPALAKLRREVVAWGTTFTHQFDEADVTLLIAALSEPEADECSVEGCDRPGFYAADYKPACHGHAAGFSLREDEAS